MFSIKHLSNGEYFITEGIRATQIGFLIEGVVRAFYRTAKGVEYNKHFFTGHSFIGGYSSLINGEINHINQQALSDCIVLVADYDKLSLLYSSCRDLETAARKLAEIRFIEKEKREIDLVLLDADRRYLLFREENPGIEKLIPQYHIASYLGITPTQLSRIRKKLLL